MSQDYLIGLLRNARSVLDGYMFDMDEDIRDEVAEVCMAIDDVLPKPNRAHLEATEADQMRLARSAA